MEGIGLGISEQSVKGIDQFDRYLYVGYMRHDADAWAVGLLRFVALRTGADAGGLRGGNTGTLESAGLGISPAWRDLPDTYARRSCSGVAWGTLHGGARGKD